MGRKLQLSSEGNCVQEGQIQQQKGMPGGGGGGSEAPWGYHKCSGPMTFTRIPPHYLTLLPWYCLLSGARQRGSLPRTNSGGANGWTSALSSCSRPTSTGAGSESNNLLHSEGI